MYADETGTELVDVVVLDVNLAVALDIDVELREQMEQTPASRSVFGATIHRQARFASGVAFGGLIADAKAVSSSRESCRNSQPRKQIRMSSSV